MCPLGRPRAARFRFLSVDTSKSCGVEQFCSGPRDKAASELQGIPIIVVSGADMHTVKARALASGAKAYLQKPAENAELLAVVAEFIGESVEGAPAGLA